MSEKPDYSDAKYVKSVVELDQLPVDTGAEVAFIGRSNAGKSSALNTITDLKNLARVSKTPGRTQSINLFQVGKNQRLMDLPGYGYAKVPRLVKERWAKNIDIYLQSRDCLQGLVLIMDIRHPLKELDQHLITWAVGCQIPVHILLTKADKLKRAAAKKVLLAVSTELAAHEELVSIQLFSSIDRQGVKEAQGVLDFWLCQ